MYVYVKNGKIYLTTEEKTKVQGCQEYITNHKKTDRLIFENGQVKLYENSKQYIEDTNRYHLQKELKEEKRKNKELTKIANTKVSKARELERR